MAMLDDIISGFVDAHRKQWALRVNGDIWQAVESAIRQRGPNPTHVTKVKSHTEGQSKLTTEETHLPECNDRADRDAAKARDYHDQLPLQYADLTFMKIVQMLNATHDGSHQ